MKHASGMYLMQIHIKSNCVLCLTSTLNFGLHLFIICFLFIEVKYAPQSVWWYVSLILFGVIKSTYIILINYSTRVSKINRCHGWWFRYRFWPSWNLFALLRVSKFCSLLGQVSTRNGEKRQRKAFPLFVKLEVFPW